MTSCEMTIAAPVATRMRAASERRSIYNLVCEEIQSKTPTLELQDGKIPVSFLR